MVFDLPAFDKEIHKHFPEVIHYEIVSPKPCQNVKVRAITYEGTKDIQLTGLQLLNWGVYHT